MKKIIEFLKSKGYEVLGCDGGLVHYRDKSGKAYSSSEGALFNRAMEEGLL